MPTDFRIERVEHIGVGLVRLGQRAQGVPEEAQRLCRFPARIGMALFFRYQSAREQTSDQLVEHGDGSVGELFEECDQLRDNGRPPAPSVEVGCQPAWRDLALAHHLFPAFWMNAFAP